MRIDNAGRWLLTGDEHGTRLWPVTLIGNNLQVGPPQVIDSAEPGHHIDISHDGRLIVYASTANDPTFTIVDREQPSASRRFPHSPAAVPPRFSNDDRLLAIGNWGLENVEIWDVATCQRINELSTSGFTIVKFSPNGRVLATSARNEICLWDTRTWTRTSRLEWTHAGSLELSPDGSIIATVSITNQIRLIDARSMTELAVLEAPDGLQPRHMAFSPDGGMLAFNAINSHLTHVWNLRVIRERLASMGLDWNLPPYPSAPTFVYSEPLQCEIQLEPESSANGLSDPGLQ
jgi:WD40 repeat protein